MLRRAARISPTNAYAQNTVTRTKQWDALTAEDNSRPRWVYVGIRPLTFQQTFMAVSAGTTTGHRDDTLAGGSLKALNGSIVGKKVMLVTSMTIPGNITATKQMMIAVDDEHPQDVDEVLQGAYGSLGRTSDDVKEELQEIFHQLTVGAPVTPVGRTPMAPALPPRLFDGGLRASRDPTHFPDTISQG